MKLFERLRDHIGQEHDENIIRALNDKKIETSIKKLMKEDRIRLLNEQKQPIMQAQIIRAGTKLLEEGNDAEDHEGDNIVEGSKPVDSTLKSAGLTTLEMQDFDLQMIQRDVLEHIRRNSKLPGEIEEERAQ